jgi:hypothetical protein
MSIIFILPLFNPIAIAFDIKAPLEERPNALTVINSKLMISSSS